MFLLNSWDEQPWLAHPVCTYKVGCPELKATSNQFSAKLHVNQESVGICPKHLAVGYSWQTTLWNDAGPMTEEREHTMESFTAARWSGSKATHPFSLWLLSQRCSQDPIHNATVFTHVPRSGATPGSLPDSLMTITIKKESIRRGFYFQQTCTTLLKYCLTV